MEIKIKTKMQNLPRGKARGHDAKAKKIFAAWKELQPIRRRHSERYLLFATLIAVAFPSHGNQASFA